MNKKAKHLTILRGIQGSGKTTYARQLPDAVVVSADHFFTSPEGDYVFDLGEIHEAHQDCFRRFMALIQEDVPEIVVDNTNIEAWEISPYYLAGESYGYEVTIITLEVDPEIAAARQLHGVDRLAVLRGSERLKKVRLPRFWRHQVITS